MLDTRGIVYVVLFSVSILGCIACILLVFGRRKKLSARWKKTDYLAISTVGICMMMSTHIVNTVVTGPPDYELVLFHLGLDLFYWPLLVRTWRIISIHSWTLDIPSFKFVDGSTTIRKREHKWLLTRMGVGLVPSMLLSIVSIILVPEYVSFRVLDWIYESYNIMTTTVLLTVTVWHMCIRSKIRYDELKESSTLLAGCILALAHFYADLIWWYAILWFDQRNAELNLIFHIITLVGLNATFYVFVGAVLADLYCGGCRKSEEMQRSTSAESGLELGAVSPNPCAERVRRPSKPREPVRIADVDDTEV